MDRTSKNAIIFRLSIALCALSPSLAWSNETVSAKTEERLDQSHLELLQSMRNQSIESFIAQQLQIIRTHGHDREYIDQTTIEEMKQQSLARDRAQFLNQVMSHDMNGDSVVTFKELEDTYLAKVKVNHYTNEQRKQLLERNTEQFSGADSNHDKKIELKEAYTYGTEQAKARIDRTVQTLKNRLSLDPNKDGKLTSAEMKQISIDLFSKYDTNSNGLIENDENNKIREALNQRKKVTNVQQFVSLPCDLPKVQKSEKIILLSLADGSALSNIAVSGPDNETTTGKIVIEPGQENLYVIASIGNPFIFQVTGETQRISKFVILPDRDKTKVGVIGLPKPSIHFIPPGSCYIRFGNADSGTAKRAIAIVNNKLGTKVSQTFRVSKLHEMNLPSGSTPKANDVVTGPTIVYGGKNYTIDPKTGKLKEEHKEPDTPKSVSTTTWSEFKRSYPAGLAELDAKDIVSNAEPEPYDIYPGLAGLVQLEQQGKIERLSDGTYYIKKPIARYPARLTGGHSVHFLLARGIPEPQGDPGHSCVISEDTGQPVEASANSSRCR